MNLDSKILDGIKILSTDSHTRLGVYAIRYLSRAGATVDSIGQKSGKNEPIGSFSKYLNKSIVFSTHNPYDKLKYYLQDINNNYDIINPISVSKMLELIKIDTKLNLNLNYLLPSINKLVIADDKEKTMNHAESVGINCPKTFTRIELEDLERPEQLGISFPCIIKFRGDYRETHWRPEDRYKIVFDKKNLIESYMQMHSVEEYPIIQEFIEGEGVGFFALYDRDKRIKAQFCHRRIREYPISGGPSSCCESIFDQRLIDLGRTLLESLDWTGLAMVECKYDRKRDKFYLIEINPRYWGSLPLAVYSGVNFPVLHMLSALDNSFDPVLKYRLGVKMRFLNTDIKSIIMSLKSGQSTGKRIELVKELFNPKIKEGFLTLDDLGFLFKLVKSRF